MNFPHLSSILKTKVDGLVMTKLYCTIIYSHFSNSLGYFLSSCRDEKHYVIYMEKYYTDLEIFYALLYLQIYFLYLSYFF